jgi:hypothetical protein
MKEAPMSSLQSALRMDCAPDSTTASTEWGPLGRALAAIGYLFTVGMVFTSVAGAVLYLIG